MTLEELRVIITAETSGLQKAVKTVQKQLSTLNNTVSRVTGTISNQFKNLGNRISNSFKSLTRTAGLLAGSAALLKLGQSAIQAASDLQEIQNVVNVVFGDSAGMINQWAKTTLENFGLIESEAKNIAATFKAMSNGMGVVDTDGRNMSITLTQLAGDLASFYNTTSDVAATALSSVFTGETESLKKFGVVMTEANLEAYALSQGITRSYSAMSQAEKVALRYNYVLQATADAQGDFARSSNSWANQIRILKGQWTEFLGVLGTALTQVLAPLLEGLNKILASLITFAKTAFSMMGIDFSVTAASVSSTAASVGDLDTSLGNAAESAKKVRKELASFDELNILGSNETDSGSGGSGGGDGTGGGGLEIKEPEISMEESETANIGNLNDMLTKLNDWFNNTMSPWLEEKAKWLAEKVNWMVDTIPWGQLGTTAANGLNGIINALEVFFSTVDGYDLGAGLAELVNNFIDTFDAYQFGSMIGEQIRLGLDIAIGFVKNLDGSALGQAIADWFNGLDIVAIAGKVGEFLSEAIKTGLDIAIAFLAGTDGGDLKAAWDAFWSNIDFEGIKQRFIDLFDEIGKQIDECFGEGTTAKIIAFTELILALAAAYGILSAAVAAFDAGMIFSTLYVDGTGLLGLLNNLSLAWAAFVGGLNLPPGLTDLLVSPFKTMHAYLTTTAAPAISAAILAIGNAFAHPIQTIQGFATAVTGAFSTAGTAIAGFATSLPGKISAMGTSISGFFTGIVSGISSTMASVSSYIASNGVLGTLIAGAKGLLAGLQGVITKLFAVIAAHPLAALVVAIVAVVAAIKNLWDNCENFRQFISDIWNNTLKPIIDNVKESVEELIEQHLIPLWENSLKPAVEEIGTVVQDVWNIVSHIIGIVIEVLSPVVTAVIGLIGSLLSSVIDIFGNIVDVISGVLDFITGVFTGDWEKAWEGIKKIFKGVWDALVNIVKTPINAIIGFINGMVGGIVAAVNVVIRALNRLSVKVPDWVPGIGGKSFGFNIKQLTAPQIPYLAKGGVIEDPTIAMMGEYPGADKNPEIVTPQNIMRETMVEANGEMISAIYQMAMQIVDAIENIDMEVSIGDETIAQSAKRGSDSYKRRTGKPLFA